nr:transglycosylase SLT domain-containing protein [Deferrivibrio essentukiensis]
MKEKVNFVKKYVFNYAGVHRIRPEVIFSIIHNESYFNPLAKSYVPAYGLMQIVPKTAGADATKFLFGKEKILAPSYLYNPDNNIKIGAAYFRILYYSYLKDIKNPTSRLYCSIAAYNTGSGNVAKAFVGSYNISAAVNVINRMSPDDVYRTLKRSLPYDETKRYLDKVLDKIKVYEAAL